MQRVVVVDDDDDVVTLLVDVLEREGYAARGFTDPHEALRALAAEPPALVLLDCVMPGMHGSDVLRALEDAGVDVPVLLLTALSDPGFCIDVARCAVVNKPFELEHLLAEIERVLDADDEPRSATRARRPSAST